MNTTDLGFSALALALLFSASATAQGLSKDQYKAAKQKITAECAAAKTACDSLSGNTRDICIAEARGKEKIAKAEVLARHKPSLQTHHKVRVASAQASYAVALERCDDLAGNVKDVCVEEAKAAQASALADADVELKTAQADKAANEKTSEARIPAQGKAHFGKL